MKSGPATVLFSPGNVPWTMSTAQDPSALPQGVFNYLRGVRSKGGVLEVVRGSKVMMPPPVVENGYNTEFRGAWSGTVGGVNVLLAAYRVYDDNEPPQFDEFRVYRGNPDGDWNEITTTGDTKWGVTRIDASANFVSFAAVFDGYDDDGVEREVVAFCDGYSPPRVWIPKGVDVDDPQNPDAIGECALHMPIEPPVASICKAEPGWDDSFDVGGIGWNTTNTDAQFVPSVNGAFLLTGTQAGEISGGATAIFYKAVGSADFYIDSGTKSQLMVIAAPGTGVWEGVDWWSKMSLSIGDWDVANGRFVNSFQVWDATNGGEPEEVAEIRSGRPGDTVLKLAAFDMSNCPSRFFTAVKFTWETTETLGSGTDGVFTFAAIGGGGQIPGGSSFTVAHRNPGGRAESRGVACKADKGVRLTSVGAHGIFERYRLPVIPTLRYSYYVTTSIPLPGEVEIGVSVSDVYCKPFGDRFYFKAGEIDVATWVPGDSRWNAKGPAQTPWSDEFNKPGDERMDPPDAYMETLPSAAFLKTVGKRLAAARTGGIVPIPDLWVSDSGKPFRHRQVARWLEGSPDPDSGLRTQFPGEQVRWCESLVGSQMSVESLFVFTDSWLYTLETSDVLNLSRPRRLSPHGCIAGRTVAAGPNDLWWLDQEKRLVRLGENGVQVVSHKVYDLSNADLTVACGTFFDDRFFMSYGLDGDSGSPIQVVVEALDGRYGVYETLRPAQIRQYLKWYDADEGVVKLLGFTSGTDNRTYVLEDETATGGDDFDNRTIPIPVVIRTGYLSENFWDTVCVGRVGLFSDAVSSDPPLLSVSKIAKQPSEPGDNHAQMDTTIPLGLEGPHPGLVYRYDRDSFGQPSRIIGNGVAVALSGNLKPGYKFYAMNAEIEMRDRRPGGKV